MRTIIDAIQKDYVPILSAIQQSHAATPNHIERFRDLLAISI
jgi:hypothetical protein